VQSAAKAPGTGPLASQPPCYRRVLRTMEEAAEAAREASALCDQAARVERGLIELLVNAIEHGNLGLDHALKAQLLACGRWQAEIAKRLDMPSFRQRQVVLSAFAMVGGWCFEIADDGAGFDWRPWLAADPARAAAPNGRGIALARSLCFDELYFLPPGNRVRALVFDTVEPSAWSPVRGLRAIAYNRAP